MSTNMMPVQMFAGVPDGLPPQLWWPDCRDLIPDQGPLTAEQRLWLAVLADALDKYYNSEHFGHVDAAKVWLLATDPHARVGSLDWICQHMPLLDAGYIRRKLAERPRRSWFGRVQPHRRRVCATPRQRRVDGTWRHAG